MNSPGLGPDDGAQTPERQVEDIMSNLKRGLFATAGLALMLTASVAQAQQPVRVRGTIEKADGNTLLVKTREGNEVTVKLTDNAQVAGVVKASLSDIKQNSFVGITALPQADGTQKAIEVHIFPEARRGAGEGHRPWDLMPNSTMTNATVDSEVAVSDGQKLVLKYKDGEKTFIVPPNVAVVTYAPATAADLKPGEQVFIAAAKKLPDGSAEAPNITVGRGGVNPPM
jgi:hypothetical protein